MKYLDFKNKFAAAPLISSSILTALGDNEQVLRNQVSAWKKRGLVMELKRGLYLLNENDRKINLSRVFIANQLYSPSYVSMAYALMFYDLIPERVADLTSISTRKTKNFNNPLGVFAYHHLSALCFTGFVEEKDENGYSFFIATPEKAVVDFIYLNLARFDPQQPDIFELSFRFQNYGELKLFKLKKFAELFHSKKLIAVVNSFCEFIKAS